MANPLKGEAVLALEDGRKFTLVLDFDGLIEAEQAYGKPLAAVLAEAQQGFMGAMRAVLWGALRRYHPNVAMSEAGEILLGAQAEAVAAISAAIEAASWIAACGAKSPRTSRSSFARDTALAIGPASSMSRNCATSMPAQRAACTASASAVTVATR